MGKLKNEILKQEEEREADLEFELEQAAKKINEEKPKKAIKEKKREDKEVQEELHSVDLEMFNKFSKFVLNTRNYIELNGKKYLKAEAWLYLANINGLTPSTEVIPVYDDYGYIRRVTCVCKLYNKDGEEVSQSVMMASKKEKFLRDLEDFAVFGMAETRAISRAIRNVYGFVASAAGFESTPSAEM